MIMNPQISIMTSYKSLIRPVWPVQEDLVITTEEEEEGITSKGKFSGNDSLSSFLQLQQTFWL